MVQNCRWWPYLEKQDSSVSAHSTVPLMACTSGTLDIQEQHFFSLSFGALSCSLSPLPWTFWWQVYKSVCGILAASTISNCCSKWTEPFQNQFIPYPFFDILVSLDWVCSTIWDAWSWFKCFLWSHGVKVLQIIWHEGQWSSSAR